MEWGTTGIVCNTRRVPAAAAIDSSTMIVEAPTVLYCGDCIDWVSTSLHKVIYTWCDGGVYPPLHNAIHFSIIPRINCSSFSSLTACDSGCMQFVLLFMLCCCCCSIVYRLGLQGHEYVTVNVGRSSRVTSFAICLQHPLCYIGWQCSRGDILLLIILAASLSLSLSLIVVTNTVSPKCDGTTIIVPYATCVYCCPVFTHDKADAVDSAVSDYSSALATAYFVTR